MPKKTGTCSSEETMRQAGNTAGKLAGQEERRASPAAAWPARFLSRLANAEQQPRRVAT